MDEKVLVVYWRGADSWPRSIDEKPKHVDSHEETIEVSADELFVKNGKKYYKLQCGHGTYVDLLVK